MRIIKIHNYEREYLRIFDTTTHYQTPDREILTYYFHDNKALECLIKKLNECTLTFDSFYATSIFCYKTRGCPFEIPLIFIELRSPLQNGDPLNSDVNPIEVYDFFIQCFNEETEEIDWVGMEHYYQSYIDKRDQMLLEKKEELGKNEDEDLTEDEE